MRLLRQLNLNSLKIVESAARHQNFTRAGEEQLITASAVSQRVKGLEDQLRFRIFNRRHNAVSLTPEGENFIREVREALDRIVAAGMEVGGSARQNVLKISVLPTFAMRWLFNRMPRFQEQHPELHLHVSTSYATTDFRACDLDLEIRYGDGAYAGLFSELLFHEDLTPVCNTELYQRVFGAWPMKKMRPEDLRQFTLLHSDTCTQNWESWLAFAGAPSVLEESASMHFDSCMLSFAAANAGMGFAVANRAYVAEDLAAGRLVAPFAICQPNRAGWYFVCPTPHRGLRKVEIFRKWLLEEAEMTRAHLSRQTLSLP